MKKSKFIFVLVTMCALQLSCSNSSKSEAENYKDAYLVTLNDTTFIKLRGKRVPLHNPGTYEDSVLIPVPRTEGIIQGKEIPVQPGHYNFKGQVTINGADLTVALLVDNFDDKRLDSLSWNGKYKLQR